MKKVMILLLSVLWLSLTGLSFGQTLKVAYIDFPPYEFQNNGAADGLTVKIVAEAFRRAGVKCDFVLLPWSRALPALEAGEVDALFELLKNPDRELFADYSTEVLMNESLSLFALAPRMFPTLLKSVAGSASRLSL